MVYTCISGQIVYPTALYASVILSSARLLLKLKIESHILYTIKCSTGPANRQPDPYCSCLLLSQNSHVKTIENTQLLQQI